MLDETMNFLSAASCPFLSPLPLASSNEASHYMRVLVSRIGIGPDVQPESE